MKSNDSAMKRLASFNLGNSGSTGKIVRGIAKLADENRWISYFAYPGNTNNTPIMANDLVICNQLVRRINERIAYYTGYRGCTMLFHTYKLIRKLIQVKPAVVHLHNLHNSYINLPMLFNYVKKNNIPVIWTLHDCWPFTGQCPSFTMVKCDKWKTGCYDCPQYRAYPASYVDHTKTMWKFKKRWFTGVTNMTLVTPSYWLADLVKKSFLKEYPVEIIHNGIDLSIFKPTKSDFREKHGLRDKFIVLGVAFGWGKRKGLDVFVELSKRLDERYQIVLVGTDNTVDKQLSKNIFSIHRTQDQQELAQIYSVADVFVNPTREENYPTVNMEALACGIPVVTFNTGGSPEIIDETCGIVVECDDLDALENEIVRVCTQKLYSKSACVEMAKSFDMNERFDEYLKLYEDIMR